MKSRLSFSDEELQATPEGVQLFLDHALPLSWDFNNDIAFVGGFLSFNVAAQLAARGQHKIIILLASPDEPAEQDLLLLEEFSQNTQFFLVLESKDMTPEYLAQLKAPYPPTCTLFGFETTDFDKGRFNEIAYRYASEHIEKSSIVRHSKRLVHQWLRNVPKLLQWRSITTLADCLSGREGIVL